MASSGRGQASPRIEARRVLTHVGAGIGNIVLATPLLVALNRLGWVVDLWLSADYPETASLFREWSSVNRIYVRREEIDFGRYEAVIPAIPPFYWRRYAACFTRLSNVVSRPPDARFYEDEQAYYLEFAHALGKPPDLRPDYCLPIVSSSLRSISFKTLVIVPGCKTGVMAAKRWPHYAELANRFDDVAVLGTADDLESGSGPPLRFPGHVKNLVGILSLRQAAEALSAAGVVVGNDSGLSHVAAATGTPTVMIFGPTPHRTLGQMPANVTIVCSGHECAPCWYSARLAACRGAVECLRQISVDEVANAVDSLLGGDRHQT